MGLHGGAPYLDRLHRYRVWRHLRAHGGALAEQFADELHLAEVGGEEQGGSEGGPWGGSIAVTHLAEVGDDLEHEDEAIGPDNGEPKGAARDLRAVGGHGGRGGVEPKARAAGLAAAPSGLTHGDDEDAGEEIDGRTGDDRDQEEDEACARPAVTLPLH